MLNKNIFRFASLLLAFSLLLGLAVTGCSDKDREGGLKPGATCLYYHFEMPTGEKAIAGSPTTVMVKGYNAEGNEVAAAVTESEIAKLDVDEDGLKVAETTFAKGTATLVYSFYHNSNDVDMVDAFEVVSVEDVEDGGDVYADPAKEEYTVATETLALVDDKLEAATEFEVGDDIYLKVYAVDANGTKTLMDQADDVEVISTSDAVTVGDYDATQEAYKCKAEEEANVATLVTKVYGLIADGTTVSVKTAGPKQIHFIQEGSENVSMDEAGHILLSGETVKNVEDLQDAIKPGAEYASEAHPTEGTFDITFIALVYTGDDESGYPLFTKEGVPETAEAECELEYGNGVTISASYEYSSGTGKLIYHYVGSVADERSKGTCWLKKTDEFDCATCTVENRPGAG